MFIVFFAFSVSVLNFFNNFYLLFFLFFSKSIIYIFLNYRIQLNRFNLCLLILLNLYYYLPIESVIKIFIGKLCFKIFLQTHQYVIKSLLSL